MGRWPRAISNLGGGIPGSRTNPSQFCTCAFSASVSPFSKLKEMVGFLPGSPSPSLTLIVAKHSRTLHSFPSWGSAISAEGEKGWVPAKRMFSGMELGVGRRDKVLWEHFLTPSIPSGVPALFTYPISYSLPSIHLPTSIWADQLWWTKGRLLKGL